MIEFRRVTKVFGGDTTAVTAVRDLSFTIERGDFWSLMGPSGSGKSTVLHLIAGLTPPTSGEVLVEGRDVAKMSGKDAAELRRRRVGYVLQTFNLFPFLTAEENVGMPLVLDKVPQRDVDARVGEALEVVKMAQQDGDVQPIVQIGHQVHDGSAVRPVEVAGGLVTHDPVFAAMATRVLRLVDGSLEQAMTLDDDDAALAATERRIGG